MSKIKVTGIAQPARTAFSFTLGDILMMFKERWLIGLAAGAIVVVAMIVFRPKTTPVYSSEVTLLFGPRKDRVLDVTAIVETQVRDANELNIHLEHLRSQTFFDYLVNSFTPDEVARMQKAYKDPERPDNPSPNIAQIIQGNVGIYARRSTTIVSIIVTNKSPESAQLIANRYALRYIDYNLDHANTTTNSAIIFLRNQSDEFRSQVEIAENALADFRLKHNVATLSENQNLIQLKMKSIGALVVSAQIEQIQLKSVIEKIQEFKRDNKDLTQIQQIGNGEKVGALKTRLRELQAESELIDAKYLRRHPKKIKNLFDIEDAVKRLNESIASSVLSIEESYRTALQFEQKLKMEQTQAESKAPELDKIAVDYKFLEQEAATKKATYAKINERLNDATIASQLDNANIKVFDPAYLPSQATNPGLVSVIAKSGVVGLCIFIIIPLFIGFLDTRIKTVAHVELSLGESLLGVVKMIKGLSELDRAHVFRAGKDHSLVESFRGIHSSIELQSNIGFPKTIIATSSMPGEGKSMTASNLAAVFASHGKRTILVDCDLRRPVLHTYFGVDGDCGWLQAISTGSLEVDELNRGIVHFATNVDLLPAGGISKNPTETLDRFIGSGLLKNLTSRYDLVIIDTPPVAIFPDALLLCRYCKEILFVCKFASVRIGNMRKNIRKLHDTGISVLGVVINQMPESRFKNCGFEGYGAYDQEYYRAYTKGTVGRRDS